MIGIALITLGEIATQIAASMGKYEASRKHEDYFTLAFIALFWSTPFLLLWGLIGPGSFVFSLESAPTFALRTLLEIGVLYTGVHALVSADRSTFSFLRTLTIPLLLLADLALGYTLQGGEIIGISCILAGSLLLAYRGGLSRRGKGYALLSALLAVGTISLFKYDITHYNSVEAEQGLTHLILLGVVVLSAYIQKKENVLRKLTNPHLFTQSILAGIGSVLMSFAFLFAAASVITTVKRSVEILGSVALGHAYFHEHHILLKLTASLLMIGGIALIAFSSLS